MCQVLAKGIRSGSKPACKNHPDRFWSMLSGRSGPDANRIRHVYWERRPFIWLVTMITWPVSVNYFHHLTDVTPVWTISRAFTVSASHESCENDTGCGTNHGSRQLNLENYKYSDLFQDSVQKEIFDAISDALLLLITFPSRCTLCVLYYACSALWAAG